jgi:hypothetical protein
MAQSAVEIASRQVLSNDLPTAIRHLDDQQLGRLQAAVAAEQQRRGKKSPVRDKIPSKRLEVPTVSLTPGKLNAVRAAFKAGVTPEEKAALNLPDTCVSVCPDNWGTSKNLRSHDFQE